MMTATAASKTPSPGVASDQKARAKGSGGSFGRYVLERLLLIIATVFILVSMVFVLMHMIGDPITAQLGGRLPPDQLQERIHAAGYDRPILVQYVEYLAQLVTGNFGTTITTNQQISTV